MRPHVTFANGVRSWCDTDAFDRDAFGANYFFTHTTYSFFGISFLRVLKDEVPIFGFPKIKYINSAKRFYP